MSRSAYSLQILALSRIFYAKFGNTFGTVFSMDFQNKQYLITAKHIASLLKFSQQRHATLPLFFQNKLQNFNVSLVGHCSNDADISVLAPHQLFHAPIKLSPASPQYAYGDDVFFFGFPFNDETNSKIQFNDNSCSPFVKKGNVSHVNNNCYFLHGHSNPGFSGAPVVIQHLHHSNDIQQDLYHVIGVVRGFQTTQRPVTNQQGKTILEFKENSGITRAYDIQNAINIIKQNPIGFPISPYNSQTPHYSP